MSSARLHPDTAYLEETGICKDEKIRSKACRGFHNDCMCSLAIRPPVTVIEVVPRNTSHSKPKSLSFKNNMCVNSGILFTLHPDDRIARGAPQVPFLRRGFTRGVCSLFRRLCTGSAITFDILERFGRAPASECTHCQIVEDIRHVLHERPTCSQERFQLISALRGAGLPHRMTKNLLFPSGDESSRDMTFPSYSIVLLKSAYLIIFNL